MTIIVEDSLSLELITEEHAEAVFGLITSNRRHLRQWLPWVDQMRTLQNFIAFIRESKKRIAAGTDMGYVIIENECVVGRAGIYNIDGQMKSATLGYWLGASFEGRGIITKSCRALIAYGFNNLGLDQIEIRCASNNLKSKAIAERLQFNKKGIIKNGEFLNRKFIDLDVYTLFKHDWHKAP